MVGRGSFVLVSSCCSVERNVEFRSRVFGFESNFDFEYGCGLRLAEVGGVRQNGGESPCMCTALVWVSGSFRVGHSS